MLLLNHNIILNIVIYITFQSPSYIFFVQISVCIIASIRTSSSTQPLLMKSKHLLTCKPTSLSIMSILQVLRMFFSPSPPPPPPPPSLQYTYLCLYEMIARVQNLIDGFRRVGWNPADIKDVPLYYGYPGEPITDENVAEAMKIGEITIERFVVYMCLIIGYFGLCFVFLFPFNFLVWFVLFGSFVFLFSFCFSFFFLFFFFLFVSLFFFISIYFFIFYYYVNLFVHHRFCVHFRVYFPVGFGFGFILVQISFSSHLLFVERHILAM